MKNSTIEQTKVTPENNDQLARELYNKASDFVKREFNYIQLDVVNKVCDDTLYEYIQFDEDECFETWCKYDGSTEVEETIQAYNTENETTYTVTDIEENDDLIEYIKQNCEGWEDYRESQSNENYPMWNTLFELRENWSAVTENAEKCGIGVISGCEDFNDMLFFRGCGYSFYGAHWIPLYLAIFEDEAKKYEGVKYEMM